MTKMTTGNRQNIRKKPAVFWGKKGKISVQTDESLFQQVASCNFYPGTVY